jgi:tetratricopeptide (TPR) repeat protein
MIPFLPPRRHPLRRIVIPALLPAIFCSLLFLPLFASARTLTIDADSQFEYAQHLFSEGLFEQAATEFNRFIYFFPEDDRVENALFQAGLSFYKMTRFQEAKKVFGQVIERGSEGEYVHRAALMIAECRVQLHDVEGAIASLDQLIRDAGDPAVRDAARHRLAWLMIETAEWEKATRAFHSLSPEGKEKFGADKILSTLETTGSIERKSPFLAGSLSIVPGAGHLYCDRPRDATIAFLLNVALAASAWQAFDNDMAWLGGLISFAEIGVYSGTIYSAISSAHKYNRRQQINFIEQLKRQSSTAIFLNPVPGGFQLSLNIDF